MQRNAQDEKKLTLEAIIWRLNYQEKVKSTSLFSIFVFHKFATK